jgi:hypothetical protein
MDSVPFPPGSQAPGSPDKDYVPDLEPKLRGLAENWGKGRPRGAVNGATKRAREFAELILCSQEYRDSLVRRIRTDSLAPNIEALLYHYAYGKPKERVELSEAPPQLDAFSDDELQLRAAAVFRAAREQVAIEKVDA